MKKGIEIVLGISVVVIMLVIGAGVYHSVYSQNSESCDNTYGEGNWILADNNDTESLGFGTGWICQARSQSIIEEVLG